MASDDPRFACPACGKSYRWKPEMAGRSAKCGCGGKLVVPAERPASNGADAASATPKVAAPPAPAKSPLTSPRPDKAASGPACPWCNKPLPEGAVLCVNCGYNLKTKQRLAVVVETVDVDDEESAADEPAAAGGPEARSPAKGDAKSGG